MIGKIKKDNDTLNTLLLSILGVGIIVEIIGIFFTNNVINFTISLWIGVAAALISAVHMCATIEMALTIGEHGATKYLITHNLIRYGILVVVFAVVLLTQIFNPIITFIGLMTLKVGAYLQPFTYRILQSKKK